LPIIIYSATLIFSHKNLLFFFFAKKTRSKKQKKKQCEALFYVLLWFFVFIKICPVFFCFWFFGHFFAFLDFWEVSIFSNRFSPLAPHCFAPKVVFGAVIYTTTDHIYTEEVGRSDSILGREGGHKSSWAFETKNNSWAQRQERLRKRTRERDATLTHCPANYHIKETEA